MAKAIAAIASIVFPPLGVMLRKGFGRHLAINLGLTLCLWLPGFLHAIYHCVKDDIENPDAPNHGEPISSP